MHVETAKATCGCRDLAYDIGAMNSNAASDYREVVGPSKFRTRKEHRVFMASPAARPLYGRGRQARTKCTSSRLCANC